MNKNAVVGSIFAVLCFVVGCSSTQTAKHVKQGKEIERVVVDYKGSVLGAEIPAWVEAAINDDFVSLQNLPEFKDKDRLPVIAVERGKNLDLLKSWANNFSAQAQVSRAIQNKVSAEFGGNQEGDKNIEENSNFIKELVATFSNTKISGFKKERDYWVKMKTRDNYNKTEEQEYEYYVLYSISNKDLQYQIDVALGKIAVKNQKQQELKNEVKDVLAKLKSEDLSTSD